MKLATFLIFNARFKKMYYRDTVFNVFYNIYILKNSKFKIDH